MIVICYEGIDKNYLIKENDKFIDLESSCFWREEEDVYLNKTGKRSRHDDWYIYYCQMAQYLSRQGYIVFVSCDEKVRNWLDTHNSEKVCVIFPNKKLKNDWLKRLKDRYENSKSDKDLLALTNVEKSFDNDIYNLLYECQTGSYHNAIILDNIDYDLEKLIVHLSK